MPLPLYNYIQRKEEAFIKHIMHKNMASAHSLNPENDLG